MSEISELLKVDVERAVGFKIKSTAEYKKLGDKSGFTLFDETYLVEYFN